MLLWSLAGTYFLRGAAMEIRDTFISSATCHIDYLSRKESSVVGIKYPKC